jgi:hypothetical protein
MTARQHARKIAYGRAGVMLAAMAVLAGISIQVGGAATTEYVVADRNSGLAISGFDPIAYFTDRAALPGKAEFEYRHAGVVWRFRNQGNHAAFAADPDIYMPRFGGYDPVGVGRGVAVPGDPRLWMIVGDRLYLFYLPEHRAAFEIDSARIVVAADQQWPLVQLTLSP